MKALEPGRTAPAVPGLDFSAGPTALWFFKVTCPVCQMAAPKARAFAQAYPGRVAGVGQDSPEQLADFDRTYPLSFDVRPDLPPYELSTAYGIRVVPTLFLISSDGDVLDSVESWDREGYNRVSERLATVLGVRPVAISAKGDGLPPFRPG